MCVCETWSLTLREEHRLRMFDNRELWNIFRSKIDEVVGNWRRLLNEELHDLLLNRYYWDLQIKRDEVSWACSKYGVDERGMQGFEAES